MRGETTQGRSRWTGWLLRIGAAAMLAVDADVHGRLAQQSWQGWHPITPAQLFGAEALGAALVGVALLLSARTVIWLVAALVGFVGVVAVVLTYYVDIPAIGPIPSMYEPIWTSSKTSSAVAEGLALLIALYALRRRFAASSRRRRSRAGDRLPAPTVAIR
jgi:hypothetical protein